MKPSSSPYILSPELTAQAIHFHGHHCPGLSYGLRAAAWALEEMGAASDTEDEEIVCVTETDMCAVDAIQSVIGCTFGKGNLIHQPYGKVAFSFFRRRDHKSARLVQNPHFRARHMPEKPSPADKKRFIELLMVAPFAELFSVQPTLQALPPAARIQPTIICAHCGEGTMESCVRSLNNQLLCLPCYHSAEIKTPFPPLGFAEKKV